MKFSLTQSECPGRQWRELTRTLSHSHRQWDCVRGWDCVSASHSGSVEAVNGLTVVLMGEGDEML